MSNQNLLEYEAIYIPIGDCAIMTIQKGDNKIWVVAKKDIGKFYPVKFYSNDDIFLWIIKFNEWKESAGTMAKGFFDGTYPIKIPKSFFYFFLRSLRIFNQK